MRGRRRERDVLPHRRLGVVEGAPPFLLCSRVAALERLCEAHDPDPGGTPALERLGDLRGIELRELDIGRDPPTDLAGAVAKRPVESELLALVRARQDLRNVAAPRLVLEGF